MGLFGSRLDLLVLTGRTSIHRYLAGWNPPSKKKLSWFATFRCDLSALMFESHGA
jgi:hypothetical protein